MLERFFHDPEAERVAALAEDRTAFFAEYYGEMAKKYLEWFVKDASSNNSILFFRRSEKSRLVQYLACVHNMLMNLGISRDVPEAAKPLMRAAIERACRDVFGTEP